MKVLVIGSGGREHAIAWKISQSPRLTKLYIAPGNPGTAKLGQNVPINSSEQLQLVNFAISELIDLVIIGPEVPLAEGLADAFTKANIKVFGPTQKAAQIESSKSFSKDFMARHQIPTARYAIFEHYDQAVNHLKSVNYPVVIKASGLAAGKGVILPESIEEGIQTLKSIMLEREFGSAGEQVVIEERLFGQEVSLMAFTDGISIIPMPPAQDHKRLLDHDLGPNTGGMGAYAPAPVATPELLENVYKTILLPTVKGMAEEENPFTGILYVGLILTQDGPRVLEYNCRFGDPETQVVLPLLKSDLLDITEACTNQSLKNIHVQWKKGSAICVVLASGGYPGKSENGKTIFGLETLSENTVYFHAGTTTRENQVVTSGGRVLGIVGWGDTFMDARQKAYQGVDRIQFEGMQYRKDIGHHVLKSSTASQSSAYASSGVNIDAGNKAVRLMKDAVQSTYTPAVLAGIGSFGGLFDATSLKSMTQPVLVASTDGVGTKVKIAAEYGQYESIGYDIVNHCIDDILVQGARPLFFLDYIASSNLVPEMVASVVTGISKACKESGVVVLGGETAEMPGVYQPGEFDLAGTIIGVLEKGNILPKPTLHAGDLLLGLKSHSPHTNGYSLIRKIFEGVDLKTVYPELGIPLGDALLKPHRSYLPLLNKLLTEFPDVIKGLAHLTGGGFIENIPRILPSQVNALIDTHSWTVPPLFNLIQNKGRVNFEEMYRVFNMGIGMVAIIAPENLSKFQENIPEETFVIGKLVKGEQKVILQ